MKIKACKDCEYFYERSCKKTIELKWYDFIEGIEHIDYMSCIYARKDYDIAGNKGRYWTQVGAVTRATREAETMQKQILEYNQKNPYLNIVGSSKGG